MMIEGQIIHKLKQDIEEKERSYQKELQKILNTRNRLYYKRQKLDSESEKDVVTKEIINITSILQKVRKEIRLCDEVGDNARKMKEQIKKMKESEKEKTKIKEKRYER